ncbi:MAG TPA: epoxyqueuosine reductase QueH [Candidatus Eisenbergiella merdigallinarum]|uniref:Epoxyqueuosine reductase QueH n=1 Tax=Candidatus Eisenbergiella merdigallinarum TaxID=2838552 RepID=A0A9D2MSB6_9FIRM|nr:epoxyqueuosine reductase QueH [Candidatus Eisenbergiella merdigallinarum]
MNQKVNYQLELEKELKRLPDRHRRLFLHSCCAPCSSYCLEYLRQYFDITVFYYNPNITFPEEYRHRVEEQKRLIGEMNARPDSCGRISFVEGAYEPARFLEAARGLEDCPEGGERCFACYALRLSEAARTAAEGGYDYFTTTLSISPLKNAGKLNAIGEAAGERYGVRYLPSDFKKKGGYQRSIELSREYGLYRQDYCGCVFSKAEREGRSADSGKKDEDAGGNIEK